MSGNDILKHLKIDLWRRWESVIAQKPRLAFFVELVAVLLIIGSTLPYIALFVKVKSTTSLENDEIYTIMNFSSQGVLDTLTDYHAPNIHIFFNLLNAMTPVSFRYGPFQARFWSFMAMGGTLTLALYFFFRHRLFLEGALLFQTIVVNYHLMDIALKARGYGLLIFFAMASSLAVIRYFETGQRRWLALISLFTVLGTWTVPNYIFFGGMLLLLLWLWRREWPIFIAGAFTAAAVVGVYLPVMNQLLLQMGSYAEEWRREFGDNEAITLALRIYVLNPSIIWTRVPSWSTYIFLVGLLILPLLIWKRDDRVRQGIHLLALASALLFVISRIMETPLIRTVSFVAMPLLLSTILILGQIIRNPKVKSFRLLLFVGIALFFLAHNTRQAKHFHFIPPENWADTAKYVMQVFPDDMPMYVTLAPDYLEAYLDDNHPITREFDQGQYLSGELILVDTDWLISEEERWRPIAFSPASVEALIPQKRGNYQSIAVTPLGKSYVERVTSDSEEVDSRTFDREIATRISANKAQSELDTIVTFRVYLESGRTYRSLYVMSLHEELPRNLTVYLGIDGGQEKLDENSIRFQKDLTTDLHRDFLTIMLGDRDVDYVDLIISPAESDRYFSINEVWAYPAVYEEFN